MTREERANQAEQQGYLFGLRHPGVILDAGPRPEVADDELTEQELEDRYWVRGVDKGKQDAKARGFYRPRR